MTGFYVNQLFGFPSAKIFCSLPGCMLVEPSGDIDSNAGIKGVVGTEDDIDEPVHVSINLLCGFAIHSFRMPG